MSSKRLYNSPLPVPSVLFLSLTGHLPKPFPQFPFPICPSHIPSFQFCSAMLRVEVLYKEHPWKLQGEGLLRKYCCSFGFCPNYLPPPSPSICLMYQHPESASSLKIVNEKFFLIFVRFQIRNKNVLISPTGLSMDLLLTKKSRCFLSTQPSVSCSQTGLACCFTIWAANHQIS